MNTPEFAISVHDVSPHTWEACARLLECVPQVGVPVTWLVTPHHHRRTRADADPAFVRALRARVAAGDEIALHGYFHLDEESPPRTPVAWWQRRILTDAEGEFAAISLEEARRRIALGTGMLTAAGLAPRGFVAPAWLMGPGVRAALEDSGLAYASTRDELLALPGGTAVRAPSLVWSSRTGWRRGLSWHWNRWRLDRLASTPRVRVALHPADAEHPEVLRAWSGLLTELAAARRPVLESSWLPDLRASAASAPGRPRAPASPGRAAAG